MTRGAPFGGLTSSATPIAAPTAAIGSSQRRICASSTAAATPIQMTKKTAVVGWTRRLRDRDGQRDPGAAAQPRRQRHGTEAEDQHSWMHVAFERVDRAPRNRVTQRQGGRQGDAGPGVLVEGLADAPDASEG